MTDATFHVRETRVHDGWAFGKQADPTIYEVCECRDGLTDVVLATASSRAEAINMMQRCVAEKEGARAR